MIAKQFVLLGEIEHSNCIYTEYVNIIPTCIEVQGQE